MSGANQLLIPRALHDTSDCMVYAVPISGMITQPLNIAKVV